MEQRRTKFSTLVAALLVIVAGVLLFLFNTGVLSPDYRHIVFSWQSLLIAVGFSCLFSRHKQFLGIISMLVGGYFLLPELNVGWADFSTQNGLAIGLIIGGILIALKVIRGRHFHGGPKECHEMFHKKMEGNRNQDSRKWENRKNESGFIDRNYVFGGANEKLDINNFKGGEINCVFGGMELDLTGAQLAEGVNHLEINTIFGGISLFVPIEWNIEVQQTQVFGNFADNRPKPGFEVDEKRTLILEVTSVFGGGEIKCKNR